MFFLVFMVLMLSVVVRWFFFVFGGLRKWMVLWWLMNLSWVKVRMWFWLSEGWNVKLKLVSVLMVVSLFMCRVVLMWLFLCRVSFLDRRILMVLRVDSLLCLRWCMIWLSVFSVCGIFRLMRLWWIWLIIEGIGLRVVFMVCFFVLVFYW